MVPLQKPDFQILKWSNTHVRSEAKTLGAPLQNGLSLHVDLQRTYLTTNEVPRLNTIKETVEQVYEKEVDGYAVEDAIEECKISDTVAVGVEAAQGEKPETQNKTAFTEAEGEGIEHKPEEGGYVDAAESEENRICTSQEDEDGYVNT
jgi:hypothetical protein